MASSRIAFVADVHVGNHKVFPGLAECGLNERCRMAIDTLDLARIAAEEQGCDALVVLGDLFDTVKPTPQMVAAVQEVLHSHRMPVHVLLGNHDQVSDAGGDHACAPLHEWQNIEVHELSGVMNFGDTALWMIPFRPGPASLWCPAELGSLRDMEEERLYTHNIVCLHLGLRDGKEPVFMAKTDDSISGKGLAEVCEEFKLQHVIAGNWHWRKRWFENGVELIQCGTLCPTGFDNPGFQGHGTLAIFEDGKFEFQTIPGPRFIKAVGLNSGRDNLKKLAKAAEAGHACHLRWMVAQEDLVQVRGEADLATALRGVEVLSDGVDKQVAAQGAALAARSHKTLEASLAGYVESMDLEEGVNRDGVLNRCLRYLKG